MTPLCIEKISLGGFVAAMVISATSRPNPMSLFAGRADQDDMGSPGMFLGPVAMTGTAGITYFMNGKLSDLGMLHPQWTSLTLRLWASTMGVMLNPVEPSAAQTTITQIVPNSSKYRACSTDSPSYA